MVQNKNKGHKTVEQWSKAEEGAVLLITYDILKGYVIPGVSVHPSATCSPPPPPPPPTPPHPTYQPAPCSLSAPSSLSAAPLTAPTAC